MSPTYFPGLTRPVSVSEYATLTGASEAAVVASMRAYKIPARYAHGEWWLEAPRNSEARLAQLRRAPQPNETEQKIVGNADRPAIAPTIADAKARKNKLTWRGFFAVAFFIWFVALLVWNTIINPSQPIVPSDRWDTSSIIATLLFGVPVLAGFIILLRDLSAPVAPKPRPQPAAAQQPGATARCPQPIDYGLTYDETWHALRVGGQFSHELPEGGFSKFRYKPGKWVRLRDCLVDTLAIFVTVYSLGFLIFVALNPNLPGGWTLDNPRALTVFFLGMLFPGWILWGISYAIAEHRAERYKKSYVSNNLTAFLKELHLHNLDVAAKREAEEAARKAARDAELRKRSYWTYLDGYAFERATAEVLNKHQFNAWVTPGSGDGGVDIQVKRNGLRGVVQCKAHTSCVGPAVVRDLYGVIHHTRASFGIIVSLGGFTRGAVEFARDKPILFVNIDDLIAMQEGKDVLAEAFAPDKP